MNTTMTDTETLVHRAVVDLYELHDAEAVTAVTVSQHLGMPWETVRSAMVSLQSQSSTGDGLQSRRTSSQRATTWDITH